MTDRLIALAAYASLVAFMAVLIIHVRHLDLVVIIVVGLLMAGLDFILLNRGGKG